MKCKAESCALRSARSTLLLVGAICRPRVDEGCKFWYEYFSGVLQECEVDKVAFSAVQALDFFDLLVLYRTCHQQCIQLLMYKGGARAIAGAA